MYTQQWQGIMKRVTGEDGQVKVSKLVCEGIEGEGAWTG